MELYLIRHGLAVDREVGSDDFNRALTEAGRAKTERVMRRILGYGREFDTIATSPLLRAQQTAAIAIAVGLSQSLETLPCLAPGGDFDEWLTWLADWQRRHHHPDRQRLQPQNATATTVTTLTNPISLGLPRFLNRLAIIGHEPDLSTWAERLLWNEAKATIVLKKAGIIGLTLPESGSPVGRAQLFWLTAPGLLL